MKKFLLIVCICLFYIQANSQVNLDSGLVAHYPFDGNAVDITLHLPEGIVHNANLTTDRFGQPDRAYYFNGSSAYIDLSNDNQLKPTAGVSLSLWAITSNWSQYADCAALAGNTNSGGYEIYLEDSDAEVQGYVRVNSSYLHPVIPFSQLGGEIWHLFILTYDGRYAKIYLDGNLVDTKDAGTNNPISYSSANSTLVGAEAGSGSYPEGDYFIGKIDDVRFYDRALSADEVQYIYQLPSAVGEIETKHWSVYPSPASDKVFLNDQGNEGTRYRVVDQTGRTVLSGECTYRQTVIDISGLVPGVYCVCPDQTTLRSIKFIKR